MIIKTTNSTIDPDKEPVLIVFRDDADRISMINDLAGMPPIEGQRRVYAIFPDDTDVKIIKDLAEAAINEPPADAAAGKEEPEEDHTKETTEVE